MFSNDFKASAESLQLSEKISAQEIAGLKFSDITLQNDFMAFFPKFFDDKNLKDK